MRSDGSVLSPSGSFVHALKMKSVGGDAHGYQRLNHGAGWAQGHEMREPPVRRAAPHLQDAGPHAVIRRGIECVGLDGAQR